MAWRKLGVVYGNQGQSFEARRSRSRARSSSGTGCPTGSGTWRSGSYYTAVGFDNDKAADAYRSALDIDSLDPVATNNLALILSSQGDALRRVGITIDVR